MFRVFAIAMTTLLLGFPAMAQTSSGSKPGPDDRAKQWLMLVDDSNYADSARQMGTQAKKADVSAIPALRAPLGAMANRNLKDVKLSRSSPGMPSGQYAVVRFESNFARRANTVETVTLAMAKDGTWDVVAYRVD